MVSKAFEKVKPKFENFKFVFIKIKRKLKTFTD